MVLPYVPYVEFKAMCLARAIYTINYKLLHEPLYKIFYILICFYPPKRYWSVQVQLSTIQIFSLAFTIPCLDDLA